ncbi:MAG: hypothetical protein IJT54_05870 [Candidatus Methanomethylophilaceae archaeon]|nr:hypothetical protein [Candidatus Methanomethylophilaceae archaeon]
MMHWLCDKIGICGHFSKCTDYSRECADWTWNSGDKKSMECTELGCKVLFVCIRSV